MSNLVATTLAGQLSGDNLIRVAAGSVLRYPGSILQTVYARTDNRVAYASPISGNGTTITDLNLTITPKFANSIMLITWMINGEVGENNVFVIHQDGALITTAGYEGYNDIAGNVRWSGFISFKYDADVSSTPSNLNIQYYIPAGSTLSRTYAPAIRSSNSTAQTFNLNRATAGVGQDTWENAISTGVIMEIAQ
jgi:hypothetical protein